MKRRNFLKLIIGCVSAALIPLSVFKLPPSKPKPLGIPVMKSTAMGWDGRKYKEFCRYSCIHQRGGKLQQHDITMLNTRTDRVVARKRLADFLRKSKVDLSSVIRPSFDPLGCTKQEIIYI